MHRRRLLPWSVGPANFRYDYNVDGTINSGDATIARSRSGQFIPAGPLPSHAATAK